MKILVFSKYDGMFSFKLSEIADGKETIIDSDNKCFNEGRDKWSLDLCDIYHVEQLAGEYRGYDLYILCEDGDVEIYREHQEKTFLTPEEVRNFTSEQVRENYKDILLSMQYWKRGIKE